MTEREQDLLDACKDGIVQLARLLDLVEIELPNNTWNEEREAVHTMQEALKQPTGTPAESRYGRDCGNCKHGICSHKPKPLAQYLAEYVRHELEDYIDWNTWPEAMEQALEAYQSTENVTIKIERVTE